MADINPSDLLTDGEKAAIANQRIEQFAREAYAHELNKAEKLAEDPEADTTEADEAIARISKAVSTITESTKDFEAEGFQSITKGRELKAESLVVKDEF
jgi:hypothetical protein